MVNNPTLLTRPLAEDGQKNTIPDTTDATSGLFSQQYGWQSINSLPLQAGGKAVKREDFNGAFNLLGGIAFMAQKGFTFNFDATQDYYTGCVVTDPTDGRKYECIADVSAGGSAPSADPTHWRLANNDIASKLATARNIALTGDATGSATFDGSTDANISVTVNESKHAAAANALDSMGNKIAINDGTREPLNLSLYQVYNNGYPAPYGNLLSIGGKGGGELLAEWSGADKGIGHLYYRNRRDADNLWSDWSTIAFTSDVVNYVNSVNTGGIVAISPAENGYVKFAIGLILQWGNAGSPVNFPIAFPTACLNVVVTIQVGDGSNVSKNRLYVDNLSRTGFSIQNPQGSYRYFAVGY